MQARNTMSLSDEIRTDFQPKALLLMTGVALESGRTHDMDTRAQFLKTSTVSSVESLPLKGQSVINSVQNRC